MVERDNESFEHQVPIPDARLELGLDMEQELDLVRTYSKYFRGELERAEQPVDLDQQVCDLLIYYRAGLERRLQQRTTVLKAGYAVITNQTLDTAGLIVLLDHGDTILPAFQLDSSGQARPEVIAINELLTPDDPKERLDSGWDLAEWWLYDREESGSYHYLGKKAADAQTLHDFEQLKQDILDPIYAY